MEVMYERCCGLDVHKKSVTGTLVVPGADGKPVKTTRTFGTMTKDLLRLSDWLREAGCTHVAIESTGVYWKPVYNILEEEFEVLLVNPEHIKSVPGRKTDVKDAEWIADLLRHGLLRASFVPDRPQRELRDLTRYRSVLVRERARFVNRLQKVLEDANIKLASVASDVLGKSARDMLEAIVAGQSDAGRLAELARGRLREKREALEGALSGRVGAHHRFMIAECLSQIDYQEEAIERLSKEIEERLRPFEAEIQLLDTIPGVNRRTAEVFLAEVGSDMSQFPTANNLSSWARMCPGNNESAGKRRSGRTGKGNPWLRHALIEAAHGASHTKGTYLAAQYHRIAARRGKKKALVAEGHTILVIAYHILKHRNPYKDLGPNYFDERNRKGVKKRLIQRLEQLGYEVTLKPKAA